MKNLLSKTRAAIDKYDMIAEGDKIAVGVSGGKDSLVLLCLLARLKQFYPKHFDIIALALDPCFNHKYMDYSKIEQFSKDLDVPFFVKRSNLYDIVFIDKKEKNPCSLCAKLRRGILHNMAIEHGCNKIALGHHFDDSIETFFMNLFEGGRIACFSPKSYLDRKDIWLIRPMIFCEESKIISLADRMNLPVQKSPCPVDKITNRQRTRNLIENLSKDYPALKTKVMGAMIKGNINNW